MAWRPRSSQLQLCESRVEAPGDSDVGALFRDAAVVEHQDAIAGLYRGKPMRNDNGGAVEHQPFEPAANVSLSASSADVASSEQQLVRLRKIARAIAIRCR